MGKVFSKAPDRVENVTVRVTWGGSNRTIRKIFDAERKELTDKLYPVNIL